MGENENRDVRRIITNMSRSAPDLRGQQRDSATKVEALALREAICEALDVLNLFEDNGRVVLIAKGELQAVNAEYLRVILESLFVTKAVVRKLPGLKYEVELAINPSEAAVRALLRADQRDGGLSGKLPRLVIEQPQVAVEENPPAAPVLPNDHPEALAGRRTVARYADSDKKRELELARGAEMVRRYQGQRATSETPAEESIPAHVPAESNAAEKPTDTQA
jgi:hypothetical protein